MRWIQQNESLLHWKNWQLMQKRLFADIQYPPSIRISSQSLSWLRFPFIHLSILWLSSHWEDKRFSVYHNSMKIGIWLLIQSSNTFHIFSSITSQIFEVIESMLWVNVHCSNIWSQWVPCYDWRFWFCSWTYSHF